MSEESDIPGCGALIAITVMGALPLGIVYAMAPRAFVLLVWGVGWGLVIWAARRTPKSVQDAPDPSPAGLPKVVVRDEDQVGGVRVTKVGESCTILSHPSERRSYGVESAGGADSGRARRFLGPRRTPRS